MDSENIKNIKKILVGVDDSEDAQLAFRVAMRRAIELCNFSYYFYFRKR